MCMLRPQSLRLTSAQANRTPAMQLPVFCKAPGHLQYHNPTQSLKAHAVLLTATKPKPTSPQAAHKSSAVLIGHHTGCLIGPVAAKLRANTGSIRKGTMLDS